MGLLKKDIAQKQQNIALQYFLPEEIDKDYFLTSWV